MPKLQAGGFGLKLNSGILAGQANAGSAVISDPLAIFTNPAIAILQTKMGIALQGTGVFPSVRFRGKTTAPFLVNTIHDVNSQQAAKNALIPAGAVIARLHNRVAIGLVSSVPFGLKFDYGRKWGGNRYVIQSALETLNITPTLALKLHDVLSLGIGFQLQHSEAILSSQTASSNGLAQLLLQNSGTRQKVKVHGWGEGWMTGFLFQPSKSLKLGFSYRSEIHTHLKGHVHFQNVPILLANTPALQNTSARSKVKFPGIFTLSGSYDVTSKWTTLFDIIRTNWSSINQIVLATPNNSQATVIQQKWKDTWFFSGGVNYQYSPCWLFRTGIAYDRRASRSRFRVPGIPDSDKIWTAIGATYSWNKRLSTSVSYGHEFIRKARVNLLQANPGNADKGNLTGHIRQHVDLVSLQINYQF